MGVAGLWDVIRPAGKTRSLTELSVVEGFEANPDGVRGFRVGIDASIWFFHAEYGREGENPVLRTLFFRCATLMHSPFLPLFVFDGPKRPDWKRGKKINKTSHKLIPGMKSIIESFGFEWRMAPGEAEAELAYLNSIGLIDGILSDDVDNFLFGAQTVIRNPSNNLSGNRANPVLNSAGKDDKNHTKVYRMTDVTAHPDIRLTRGGMVLIGLMSGGDYEQGGLNRCGTVTAHGLAKCGFGDRLVQAAESMTREELQTFLITWRQELSQELRTNSQGHIGRKQVALANSIPDDFPNIDILLSYTKPITSESLGRTEGNSTLTWGKEPDLGKLAATCEFYFEWGYKEAIIKRFRTVIWHSAVLRILRRAVLNMDKQDQARTSDRPPPTTPRKRAKAGLPISGTPSKMIARHFSSMNLGERSDSDDDADEEPLIVKVHSERKHTSTDGILEYRLEIAPAQLVRLAESGIKGTRSPEALDEWASEEDEEGDENVKKVPPEPDSHMRVWMPACMVQLVEPRLVEEFEAEQQRKREKKAGKNVKKAKKAATQVQLATGPDALPILAPLPTKTIQAKNRVSAVGKRSIASLQTSCAARDLTRKEADDVVGQTDHRSKSNVKVVLSSQKAVKDAGDDDDIFSKDMLVSPRKPDPMVSWNARRVGTYVAVSDSDDDTKVGYSLRAWQAHVPFRDDSHLYDSDSSLDKPPLPDLPLPPQSRHIMNDNPSSDSNHCLHKSPRKLLKLMSATKVQQEGPTALTSFQVAGLAANAPMPSDRQFAVIELSDSEPDSPLLLPAASLSMQDSIKAKKGNKSFPRRQCTGDIIDLT